MERNTSWFTRWFFYITAGCLFTATVLRSIILYRQTPQLNQILILLFLWLILFASQIILSNIWIGLFNIYIVLQTILIVPLLLMPRSPDYFAVLFAILSMQIMERIKPRYGVLLIGLFTPIMAYPWVKLYGQSEATAFALIYTGINALMGYYTWAMKRSQSIQVQNETLAEEILNTNKQLEMVSRKLEKLAVARERHSLARDLHDSVTQTIFSMTLTTQSALLLYDNDLDKVSFQLSRLNELAQRALSEMHTLITKLSPQEGLEEGLVASLQKHLAERYLPEDFSVELDVQGDQILDFEEEQNLFRILQEALNNIVKHANTKQVFIRLYLKAPFWIEIEDRGQGFDLEKAYQSGGDGLRNMHERALEIGWDMHVATSPGEGSCLRFEKKRVGEQT